MWRHWLPVTLVTVVTGSSESCEVDSVGYFQSYRRKQTPQVGALCCDGNSACSNADLIMETVLPLLQCPDPCALDVCCAGELACDQGTFRNSNTISCTGNSCVGSSFLDIGKNVFCSSAGACSGSTFQFLAEQNHYVGCQGDGSCAGSTFTYAGSINNQRCDEVGACQSGIISIQAGANLRLECVTPDSTASFPLTACDSMTIQVAAGANLELICQGVATNELGSTTRTCDNFLMSVNVASGGSCTCQSSDGAACPTAALPGRTGCVGAGSAVTAIAADPPCCISEFQSVGIDCANCGCDLPSTSTTTTCPACDCTGSVAGDPHMATLMGQKYLLLQQGTFSFWRFSGLVAESQTAANIKRIPVDFNIYAHYSGHSSYTKAFLLVDNSGATVPNILEVTADTCEWRSKNAEAVWRKVDGNELLPSPDGDGDEMTAFKILKKAARKMHIELLMKQVDGSFKKICKLFVLCKPHHFINAKMSMLEEDLRFVHGQIGPHSDQGVETKMSLLQGMRQKVQERTDQEFLISQRWTQLGGSDEAALYLSQSDESEPKLSLLACDVAEAEALCQKHLGNIAFAESSSTFDDCVFDVCHGGDEVTAELAAELLTEE